jgi:hypothetical protein
MVLRSVKLFSAGQEKITAGFLDVLYFITFENKLKVTKMKYDTVSNVLFQSVIFYWC